MWRALLEPVPSRFAEQRMRPQRQLRDVLCSYFGLGNEFDSNYLQ